MNSMPLGNNINEKTQVRLPDDKRIYHTVIIGHAQHGKTSLLEKMVLNDLEQGITAIVFDPMGDLSEHIMQREIGIFSNFLWLYEITRESVYGFNPLEVHDSNDPMEVSRTVDSLLQVFKKHWSSEFAWGPRVSRCLSACFRTIIYAGQGYTLNEIPLLFTDERFLVKLLKNIQHPDTRRFWDEYQILKSTTHRASDTYQLIESSITRLSQFLSNDWLSRILYQSKSTVKFDEIISKKRAEVYLFSLPIGRLGSEPSALLGSLLLGNLTTAIFGRIDSGGILPRIHIYIDELGRFSLPLIAPLWVQGGKWNIGLTATLQTLSQIQDEETKSAVLSAGNHICFQLIDSDARTLAGQMPLPSPESLTRPEPMLLYSQTAVQDIWQKGHPHNGIMLIRDEYFWLFHELDADRQKWWFDYPFFKNPHDKPDEWYYALKPDNWFLPFWKTSRDMLEDARDKFNLYLYRWMNHEFSPNSIGEDQLPLFEVISRMFGMLGIKPAYKHGKKEDWEAYIRQRMAYMPNMPISPRELAQMEVWEPIRYEQKEKELLTQAFTAILANLTLPGQPLPEAVKTYRQWEIRHRYCTYTGGIYQDEQRYPDDYHNDLREYDRGNITQNQLNRAIKITDWEIRNLCLAVSLLSMCGRVLEKEPLYVPSQVYQPVETSRRTYSDVRDELVTKLVSLPRYEAIAGLVGESQAIHLQTIALPAIADSQKQKAQEIKNRSHEALNRPMQEIMENLRKQSESPGGLPPAKPHI